MKLKVIVVSMLVMVTTSIMAMNSRSTSDTQFTPAQVKQIQSMIESYIVNNPQLLTQAKTHLAKQRQQQTKQQQQLQQLQSKAAKIIRTNAKQLLDAPNSIVIGNPKGSISLVEFFDYQCPHCRDTSPAVAQLITQDTDLRVVLKELPIFGRYSRQAALAVMAAYTLDPQKAEGLHNVLMAAATPFSASTIANAAEQAGYNYSQLKQAMAKKQYEDDLNATYDLAKKLLEPTIGVVATPAIVVAKTNTTADSSAVIRFIPGQATLQQLQQAVSAVRAGSS